MKAILLAVMIGLLSPTLVNGQLTSDFTQYFDGADTAFNSLVIYIDTSGNDSTHSNVWRIDTPQKVIFDSAATYPNAIFTDTAFYPVNDTSSFTVKMVSVFAVSGDIMALQWLQKLDLDADSAFDGGIIEFSTDLGTTWQNAFDNPFVYNFYGFDSANVILLNGEYAFSGTDNTWRDIWLCFDVNWVSFSDSLMFRFTLKSDSINNNKEGWLIDNMLEHITWFHVAVPEVEQEEYIRIGPNPTSSRVNIQVRRTNGFHIIEKMELINVQGQIVQEFGLSPTKFFIDIGDHPNGTYFLKIQTNLQTETLQLLLQHE